MFCVHLSWCELWSCHINRCCCCEYSKLINCASHPVQNLWKSFCKKVETMISEMKIIAQKWKYVFQRCFYSVKISCSALVSSCSSSGQCSGMPASEHASTRAVARILFQPRQRGEPVVWGRSPQRGPGAEPLVRGWSPSEAESFSVVRYPKEMENLL